MLGHLVKRVYDDSNVGVALVSYHIISYLVIRGDGAYSG